MQNLNFLRTWTPEAFKAAQGCSSLVVRRSKKSGKLFMTWSTNEGECSGAVASNGIPECPMISLVEGTEGRFYLLHEAGGAEAVATL